VSLGTIINVFSILIGAGIGVALGHRLPANISRTLTDALGLVVLVIGGLNLIALTDISFVAAVSSAGTLLVVLASLVLGSVLGSMLRIEQRLSHFGTWLQLKASRGGDKEKFIEGFVNASLLFTIGPMAVLGALQDGLGQGFDVLALKSTLRGSTGVGRCIRSNSSWYLAGAVDSLGRERRRSHERCACGINHCHWWSAIARNRTKSLANQNGLGGGHAARSSYCAPNNLGSG
jgi:hypothetical protein